MPTTKPRYVVTDTGETAELLDLAQRAWPELTDRRQALLRLARAGAATAEREAADREALKERQREVLGRTTQHIDVDVLLSDAAWR